MLEVKNAKNEKYTSDTFPPWGMEVRGA